MSDGEITFDVDAQSGDWLFTKVPADDDLMIYPGKAFPSITIPPLDPNTNTLEIRGEDGRELLVIGPGPDYIWTVAPEDAPEAARAFAECLSQWFATNRFS